MSTIILPKKRLKKDDILVDFYPRWCYTIRTIRERRARGFTT
jgi:hypothetical protein